MKLLTKELEGKFPALYSTERTPSPDKMVIAKFFHSLSDWTWYATEYDPKERLFYGLVDGFEKEWGYFSLDEMESVDVRGLGIERDLYFKTQPIKDIPGLIEREAKEPGIERKEPELQPEKVEAEEAIPESIITPYGYGRIAFEQGIIKAPAQDKAFLDKHIRGREMGDEAGLRALHEWERGFHQANIDAPIDIEKEKPFPAEKPKARKPRALVATEYPKIPEARIKELKNHEKLVLKAVKDKPNITFPELEKATKLEPVQIDGAVRRLQKEEILQKTEGEMTPGGMIPSSYKLKLAPKPTEKPERKVSAMEQLRKIHEKRSPEAQALDEKQEHHNIISPGDSEAVKRWKKDPGTADIEGIDTPKRRVRKTKPLRAKSERVKRVSKGKVPAKVKSKRYTKAELREIHAGRNPRSIASDNRQLHSRIIEQDSPGVPGWITNPGRADITGIDTPPITGRKPRLSGGRTRITPRRPKLGR